MDGAEEEDDFAGVDVEDEGVPEEVGFFGAMAIFADRGM